MRGFYKDIMGQAQRKFEILLFGLPGAGKTHLLDALVLGGDTTKRPTNGFYDVDWKGYYHFTEFGGAIDWKLHLRKRKKETDAILIVLGPHFTEEEVCWSNNLLFELHEELAENVPFGIVMWPASGKFKHHPVGRNISYAYLNYEDPNWYSRFASLLSLLASQAKFLEPQ